MKKNYLLAVASFNSEKQKLFNEIISFRNKEYCKINNFEYIEIVDNIQPIRGKLHWTKMFKAAELVNNVLNENDGLVYIDADALIVKKSQNLLPPQGKSFAYCIDTANTHNTGFFSLIKNEWSTKFMNLLIDEDRYLELVNVQTFHEKRKKYSSFWEDLNDQASLYSLAGIKRHSDVSFWELPNYGWHTDFDKWTMYSLEELHSNVHIFPSTFNVTELHGETGCRLYINKVKYSEVVIRHFAGGQKWRKVWLKYPNSFYFKLQAINLFKNVKFYKINDFFHKLKGFINQKFRLQSIKN